LMSAMRRMPRKWGRSRECWKKWRVPSENFKSICKETYGKFSINEMGNEDFFVTFSTLV
jgi:hypothetical protein